MTGRNKATEDAERHLLWLGDFIKRDVSSEEARAAAVQQIRSLVFQSMVRHKTARIAVQQFAEVSEVPAIQVSLRNLFEGLEPGSSVWLSETPFELKNALWNGVVWSRERGVMLATRSSGVELVLTAVVDLLMAIGPRLHRCITPSCRRLFASRRKGQVRCVATCGATQRVQKWRAANRERSATSRHEQYARKVKARLPGVRVARRLRKKGR
jgi:hypothetical protein